MRKQQTNSSIESSPSPIQKKKMSIKEEIAMSEGILSKIKPGAQLMPKKFLPITDEEWKLIEQFQEEEDEERVEQLKELTDKIFGRKRDHSLFSPEDFEKEIKEFQTVY